MFKFFFFQDRWRSFVRFHFTQWINSFSILVFFLVSQTNSKKKNNHLFTIFMKNLIFRTGVMTVVTTMFFRPDWPVAILYWLLQIDPKSLKSQQKRNFIQFYLNFNVKIFKFSFFSFTAASKVRRTHLTASQRFILIVAGLFCVHQTLLPLRHHIYPGQVIRI